MIELAVLIGFLVVSLTYVLAYYLAKDVAEKLLKFIFIYIGLVIVLYSVAKFVPSISGVRYAFYFLSGIIAGTTLAAIDVSMRKRRGR